MRRLLGIGATVALAALGVVTIGSAPVHAAQTLTVTTTIDENGPTTDCTDGQPGTNCSLREAIAAATTDGDVVELQPNATYLLSLGQLDHGDTALTIQGAGATIDAQKSSRVLEQGSGILVVTGLTVTNGFAGGPEDSGGAIDAHGPLTAIDSTFADNEATRYGGALHVAGTLRVFDSTLRGNEAELGGAIAGNGAIVLTGVFVIDNKARENFGFGGGVYAEGPLVVVASDISGNTGSIQGGGVFAKSTVSVRASEITANTVTLGTSNAGTEQGGGIYSVGDVDLTDTGIVDNLLVPESGGAKLQGGGVFTKGSIAVVGSTVEGNAASPGSGGGLFAEATVSITNSTITGNTAGTDPNTDPPGAGGGVAAPHVAMQFATVAGNSAAVGANVAALTLDSAASVVAYPLVGANCATGSTGSAGYSYDDDGSCGFASAHDVSGGPDPLLGPLGDNGGSTPTMHPLPGSPLVDAIPTGSCIGCVATDQRGITRPQGRGYDIGAVEVMGVEASPRFTG